MYFGLTTAPSSCRTQAFLLCNCRNGGPKATQKGYVRKSIGSNRLGRFCIVPMMGWTDRHCRVSQRLTRRRAPSYRDDASAAIVGLNFDLCRSIRSCWIIWIAGSAVTERASGESDGILVYHNYGANTK